jgi:sugar lactone lactonase YvrE
MRVMWTIAKVLFSLALALTGLLLGYIYVTYGGGRDYPDLTAEPQIPSSAIELVVTSPEPIGNAAQSEDGRVFYTIHPESRPEGVKLYEWKVGAAVPFPSRELQDKHFKTPLGVKIDRQNRLWVIDHGNHGSDGAKIMAFDLATGALVHEYVFSSDVAPLGSFLQDFTIDQAAATIYIADVSFFGRDPGIVVYDIGKKTAHRALSSHPSVFPQNILIRTATKTMKFYGGLIALKTGIDGVALSADDEWLYYAAMNHPTLYRVPAKALRDPAPPPGMVESLVEDLGPKPLSDGITADVAGGVYITDVEHGAVMKREPDGRLVTLVKDPAKIRWADSVGFGAGGTLLIADSAIPDQMLMPKSHIEARKPYFIYRVSLGVEGVPGR